MELTGRVLVLDCEYVPALDVVRSLGSSGLTVIAAAAVSDAIGFASRYSAGRLVYPDPRRNANLFVDWLAEHLQETAYDLVVPVTDYTTIPVSMHRGRLERFCKVATERFEVMEWVYDKRKTLELARQVGVPVPEGAVIATVEDLTRTASELSYPVVCKPVRSKIWGAEGGCALSVFYAFSSGELIRLGSPVLAVTPLIVQTYFRGRGVGVEVLAQDGRVLQIFQHERLHEVPITGGASTYRKSVPVDAHLAGYTSRLISRLGWTGVAMVEFKVDDTGNACLIEINGRVWGSIPLSSRAGMSFGEDLYDLLVRGRASAPRSYRVGVRCRQLRRDLNWFKESVSLRKDSPLVVAGMVNRPTLPVLAKEALRLLSPLGKYDVQLLSDPVPGLLDIKQICAAVLAGPLERTTAWLADPLWSCHQWLARKRLGPSLPKGHRILLVCYGNILRSPFAAVYCSNLAAGATRAVDVRSAGTLDVAGRSAPDEAIEAALSWGVDLSTHRSSVISRELVEWADLILVMDRSNMKAVRSIAPGARGRIFALGALDGRWPKDVRIGDPYGQGAQALRRAYHRIATAVDALVNGQ